MDKRKQLEETSYQSQKHRLSTIPFQPLSKPTTETQYQFDPLKLLFHAETITRLLQAGDVLSPVTLDVDPANRCNQNCIWCSFDYLHRDPRMLEPHLFIKLAHDLSNFTRQHSVGVRSIIFTGGGEPTLNPALPQVMNICEDSNIRCGLYTNGTFTSKALQQAIFNSCDFVRFSLEASNESLYGRLHRPLTKDAYQCVIRNIRALSQMKRRVGRGPTVGISFLLDPLNHTDLLPSARQALDLGVDYFQVKPVIKKAWEEQRLTEQLVRQSDAAFHELAALQTDSFKVIIIRKKLNDIVAANYGRTYSFCLGHYLSSVVAADGKVYLCVEHRGLKKYEMGDLHNESFYQIWGGRRRQQVISQIDLNECQPGCKGHFRTLELERLKNIQHREFL